jgi:glycosyltransferase involved in cell wall biosynthesis
MKKIKKPLISIIMPVYNPGRYLIEAIESILNQTFSNFEFIIVDDASTDDSWKIIKSYAKKDKRIIPIKNKINLGVSLTSNIAISQAKGKFLARMDADDISTTDRIQKQFNYLKKHPKTIVVGGQCTIIDEDNNFIGIKKFPTTTKQIKNMIFWAVPIQQGFMMVNRSLLPKNFSWYSPSKTTAEEVDLYFQLLKYGDFANLTDNLYYYRQVNSSLSHQNPKKTFWNTFKSRLNAINNGFKPNFTAIVINLVQIFVISVLPNQFIMSLWYLIRGINKPNPLTVGTIAQSQL